jgi:protocatechuate 3,4-dioxygenase beta subunit
MDHEQHIHDLGLRFDLGTLLERRRLLKLLAGAGLAALVGCGSDNKTASSTSTSPATTGGASDCTTIPDETAGPYPGDGSNGPNVLKESGIVRRDIRSSFGSSSTTAAGVPLTINLVILDKGKNCAALTGAAVYLWHCNRDGLYSMYSQGLTNENYLRGVQGTDSNGRVTFKSIFPGAYSGRWPHIHFEVYPSLAKATAGSGQVTTSQIALPVDACKAAYATDGYRASVRNLTQTSLAKDNVFSDGYSHQLGTVGGNAKDGFTVELSVPV